MRNAFAAEMADLAEADQRIVLMSGDIGNRLFDRFKNCYPKRFLNCGVAEANMVSMAAGMAMCGFRPVAYTIASFMTSRCFEQIRVDLCYHNVPVVIVGVGAGLSYAANGPTHHSCEDVAILRALPHITVICPADPIETRLALKAALANDGPCYIRLGKKGEPNLHGNIPEFLIGKGIVVHRGSGVCLLGTGTILPVAVEAAERLGKDGIRPEVVSLHTVKPLDEELLFDVFSRFEVVVTVEEHSVIGGLGSAVAEWIADHPFLKGRLYRIGTADRFIHEAGGQEHARKHFGLTPEAIAQKVTSWVRGGAVEVK
ncbi:MAG: transketolase [Verrucomicrobia bacterium]|nr:transketolase [Verrucomicrobiota bacterium]